MCAVLAAAATAQENSSTKPCVRPDEQVYRPGIDGVKPPQITRDAKGKNSPPDLHGPVTLALLVNSEGALCDVKVVQAKDPLDGERAADHVQSNWKFTPATRNGKPVSVQMTVNFGQPRMQR
jgi:TonB family protein